MSLYFCAIHVIFSFIVEYLPLGDDDDFDWQKKFLSEKELKELINNKQDKYERIGLNLYYENSEEGLTLLTKLPCPHA